MNLLTFIASTMLFLFVLLTFYYEEHKMNKEHLGNLVVFTVAAFIIGILIKSPFLQSLFVSILILGFSLISWGLVTIRRKPKKQIEEEGIMK